MSWIPGLDTVANAGWWSGFYFWASIFALIGLGITEVASHRYSERKDELTAIEQVAIQRRHDEDMARVQHDTAKISERAANSEREAARLRLELDREVQKRAPRILTEDQKVALTETLQGKVDSVVFVVQDSDLEARFFGLQIQGAIQNAGAKIFLSELPAGETLPPAPGGVMMYSPRGNTEEALKDDPLYIALKKARLFGGLTSKPFASFKPNPALPDFFPLIHTNGYVVYVGPKLPW